MPSSSAVLTLTSGSISGAAGPGPRRPAAASRAGIASLAATRQRAAKSPSRRSDAPAPGQLVRGRRQRDAAADQLRAQPGGTWDRRVRPDAGDRHRGNGARHRTGPVAEFLPPFEPRQGTGPGRAALHRRDGGPRGLHRGALFGPRAAAAIRSESQSRTAKSLQGPRSLSTGSGAPAHARPWSGSLSMKQRSVWRQKRQRTDQSRQEGSGLVLAREVGQHRG